MIYKKILTALLCGAIAVSTFTFSPLASVDADAATFAQINASSVFVKQQTSVTCTLASNVMLLRRTAMMRGDSDWSSITESACRSTLWLEGAGMYHNYSYKSISVSYQYISGSSRTALINALKEHPEGVVAYDYDYPHAILLTDYTDGVFYCADPANNTPSGRMSVSNSLIKIDNVDTYWYVTSPSVSFSGTSTSTSNSDSTVSTVNETWNITAADGVNIRSGAGTSYGRVGGIPYNGTFTVTKKTTSGGYTWGYTTYNSTTGWVALDYAKKVTTTSTSYAALENTSTINKTGVMLGNSLTIKGSAKGGTGSYQYTLLVKKEGASDWTTVQDYTSKSSLTFKPTSAGRYNVCMKVKDSANQIARQFFVVTASNTPVEISATINKTGVMLGNSLTVKVSAKNGTGSYQYTLLAKKEGETDWTTVQNYSTASSVAFKPTATGRYNVCIKVKDSSENVARQFFVVTVSNTPVEISATINKTGVMLGDSLTLKGTAKNGTGSYQYTLLAKKEGETDWTTVQDYTSKSSFSFKPTSAGRYNVCIKVKDSSENVARQFCVVTAGDKELVNSSTISGTKTTVGGALTIKGAASGGTGSYQYTLLVKEHNDTDWTTISDYSTKSSVVFEPTYAGKYNVCIKVKDSSNNTARQFFVVTVTEKKTEVIEIAPAESDIESSADEELAGDIEVDDGETATVETE